MTDPDFDLDPKLEADTEKLVDWKLSRVLLMNDRRFPWLILVPRLRHAVEPFDLPEAERALLWREVDFAAAKLKAETKALKINIGALGNIVRQLHIHVVARNDGDGAWPGPVWGSGTRVPYEAARLKSVVARFTDLLGRGPS
ncbi:MAG: HIT domain-containing protein [Alphaproteobacteria bacterium]|nr:HIT domain-containing protein [Alphaproteobacteria bacterium]